MTTVVMATATDENNPVSNVLSADLSSAWTTTGLYPHAVAVPFPDDVAAPAFVRVWCSGVREVAVEGVAVTDTAREPVEVAVRTLDSLREIQMEVFDLSSLPAWATAVRITILDGFGPFAAIHRIAVE
ncbi:uncharacterized protein AMSG_02568 [Thecamonas trahens ATCC 50062]|uniref:F5/8 type C domain-containing protein n=1 Tax=Thecamonas trahens ATCC 50062 TaxID=461836 RepID=A0A0L0D5B8_THETB|nr:hypothetical protein AMSG_02568 [Thecamonas trahens ATCC 50062]KNC47544.1 hypothetical protein AMSG_02568 [Thecamonas trahens ATCC 50062]|eukprot:XP_013759476.1 hypothetical protein AMSG_02568 [Thecamonas trahens ATCC 50062]